ncbi:Neogenin [Portunus trituberculatus]|uniref:Neogenin n=1 Tax=Portunus trituberculatus TaxID=210409 RepID=A0A5B7GE23_PORTR|nr:Neogenin [Portunus trituberculatus]
MRNGPALHRKINSHLGSRITFDGARNVLVIQRVRIGDGGIYRCRVHFRTNPTLTYTTNLSVLIPPRHMMVYTEMGEEAKGNIGPYVEGDNLTLHCRVRGGYPSPRVTWWNGEELLDSEVEEEETEVVTNTLTISHLTRDDLHKKLTCHANNNNLTESLATTITVDMHSVCLVYFKIRVFSASETPVRHKMDQSRLCVVRDFTSSFHNTGFRGCLIPESLSSIRTRAEFQQHIV